MAKQGGSTEEKASTRRPLSRDRVVQEAIAFIDERSINQLTMRSLGARLGVEAMSLYRYVNGREDLLEAIVAALVNRVEATPPAGHELTTDWHGYLQWMAHSVRDIALEHPAIFPLMATRHPAAAWLRPPLRSLRVVEEFLAALLERGFTEDRAVEVYRVFTSFLLGQLLLEVAQRGVSTAPAEEPLDEGDADLPNQDEDLDLSQFPLVARLRPLLSEDHSDEEFERSLEALLDRLDLLFTQ
ncbi:TetR/AcrR family transcriptional regulator [Tersicoccus sp. Bi-70]|uniref:TetR/AcrR family transcriptional regulator n=1 Tax=Tersicoccus sp. Bi-70 TaxID=1897634 RepID=UPI000975AD9F|nr:TetR/AcrR family transcriptional regulator C-terminal domain-containing protein [Tersicoccus sp. Bi-70]OMH35053.1 TetR family transcriptional regulator [Tersicoccus sp. Bi-70]